MKLDDYFDGIVVMTLDKRLKAGENSIEDEIRSFGGTPVRFLVGDGKLFPRNDYHYIDVEAAPRKQAFNYAVAFQSVIRQAESAGIQKLLYLEDDAILTRHFGVVFERSLTTLDKTRLEWDVWFLGGNHLNGLSTAVGDCVIKPTYTLDLHGVCFKSSVFCHLLSLNPCATHTIDGKIANLQANNVFQAVACKPSIILQKPTFSYNAECFIDRTSNYDTELTGTQ